MRQLKNLLLASLLAVPTLSFAVEKSDFLATGSGHYAQVILGGTTAIQPIRFKTAAISQESPDCAGVTVNSNLSDDAKDHITGMPVNDYCFLLIGVDNAGVSEKIKVEFFKLPAPPLEAEWADLLATLPKKSFFTDIFISSELPKETVNNVVQAMEIIDADLKVDSTVKKLSELTDVTYKIKNKAATLAYKSCSFELQAIDGVPLMLYGKFVAGKVGVLETDPIIENCEVEIKASSPSLGSNDQPASQVLVNYYVLKSYL